MPPEIAQRTVSAIENLRAALDIGACAVVPRHAKRKTYFPFGDTKRQFEGHLTSKAKYVPKEIKALFVMLKPYKRGNPPLWALNKLANTPKHVTIVQPGIAVKDVEFVGGSGLNSLVRHSQPRWNRRKNEIVITRAASNTTAHHDVDLSIAVTFGKVPVCSGRPTIKVLRNYARNIERILRLMESVAIKFGIIK